MITDERLKHLANHARGLDDPHDIGYYESCELAALCLSLRKRVEDADRVLECAEEAIEDAVPIEGTKSVSVLPWSVAFLDKFITAIAAYRAGAK